MHALAHPTAAPSVPSGANPAVVVVPRDALQYSASGATAGHAHVGFDGHPEDAPGHLDFEPLLLCGVGEVPAGTDVPLHPHAEVEIVDILRGGRVRYHDNLGNDMEVGAGMVGTSSAGSGLEHGLTVVGEGPAAAVILFFRPDCEGGEPSAQFGGFDAPLAGWQVLVSGRANAPADALPIRCDAQVVRAQLQAGESLEYALEPGRRAYLVGLDGTWSIEGRPAGNGDRALVDQEGVLTVSARTPVEIVLVDLPRP